MNRKPRTTIPLLAHVLIWVNIILLIYILSQMQGLFMD